MRFFFNPESNKHYQDDAVQFGNGGSTGTGAGTQTSQNASLETQLVSAQQQIVNLTNQLAAIEQTQQLISAPQTFMNTYTFFNTAEDVVSSISRRVTTGMWSAGTGSITTFFTSSAQSGSTGNYYYDVYQEATSSTTSEIQFSVAYGHRLGYGSPSIANVNTSKVESQAIYAQYRNLLLDAGTLRFGFANSVNSDDIYVINVQRARLKQKMDAGNWQLNLSGSGGESGLRYIKLIDDSSDKFDQNVARGGRVYNVVSGALNVGATASIFKAAANEPSGGYGLFYPDMGIIVLHPGKLQAEIGITAETGSTTYGNNHGKLVHSIRMGAKFQARSEETVTSTEYFVRVKNRNYNFSNNPTFYTSSDGKLRHSSFVGDPQVYITTVGLYNDQNELLAVAKLSQPLLKNFSRESLIQVKLDF